MQRMSVFFAVSLAFAGCATAAPARTAPPRTAYVYATDADSVTNEPVNVGHVEMPFGETFAGSYHSPQMGDLYLDQSGERVTGTYEYDHGPCRATGRIEGRAVGNLLRFSWSEDQSQCGRMAPITGHGYLLFWQQRARDNVLNARLDGEYGFGDAELGAGHWSAFRDRVRRPTPNRAPAGQRSIFEDAQRVR